MQIYKAGHALTHRLAPVRSQQTIKGEWSDDCPYQVRMG